MDPSERLVTQVACGLISRGVLVKTANHGVILASGFAAMASTAMQYLLEFIFYAGRRIRTAIRERNSEDSIVGVIFHEILAIGSDSIDVIIKSVMAVIDFLKKLLDLASNVAGRICERGVNFTESLGQRSLAFTSVSSVRGNQ